MAKHEDVLKSEIKGQVAVLTISRVQRRNSMDSALVEALKSAMLELDLNTQVGAIVLNGIAPGFCGGSDLKYLAELSQAETNRFEQECGDLGRLMGVISKPVIAAVEGFAMGGGFTLATCCDIVVTGRSARWNLPEVRLGWLTPWGIKSLVARVGYVNAKNLSYGLDILNGEEARSMGIADYVVDDGTVLAAALERAEKIAALPRPAAAATKRFFSNYIMEKAEVMDFEANRLFSENCLHATAQQSLARKAGKAVA